MKRQYNCKVCGELGHNSRTCKQNASAPMAFAPTNKKEDRIIKVINTKLQKKVEHLFDVLEITKQHDTQTYQD